MNIGRKDSACTRCSAPGGGATSQGGTRPLRRVPAPVSGADITDIVVQPFGYRLRRPGLSVFTTHTDGTCSHPKVLWRSSAIASRYERPLHPAEAPPCPRNRNC